MTYGNYNKISGRKTMILVIAIIATILLLTIYSIISIYSRSSVKTGSFYYEAPSPTPTVSPTTSPTPFIPQIYGD
jgi:hypothetical protein